MSWTFDAALASDLDWVRLLIGDTVEDGHVVEDESIAAILAEVATQGATGAGIKYCAAAQAGEIAAARWQAAGRGVVEKQVSKLRIRYSEGQALTAYREYLASLKCKCTQLSGESPGVLRAW